MISILNKNEGQKMQIDGFRQQTLEIFTGNYAKFQHLPVSKKVSVVSLRIMGPLLWSVGLGLTVAIPAYVVTKAVTDPTSCSRNMFKLWANATNGWFQVTDAIGKMGGGSLTVFFLGGLGTVIFGAPLGLPLLPGALIATAGLSCIDKSNLILDEPDDHVRENLI